MYYLNPIKDNQILQIIYSKNKMTKSSFISIFIDRK